MKKNLFFALILFAGGKLQAQTITSVADGNFSDPLNWDCNCVPSPGNNILIKNNIDLDVNFSYSSGSITIGPESKLSEGLITHSISIHGGSFSNSGTLRVSHLDYRGGTFINHHNITAVLSFDISTGVTAVNHGVVSAQDSLHIYPGGGLDNTGEIFALYAKVEGNCNNNGTLSGNHLHNQGTLGNGATADMKYTMLYNNGYFSNSGQVLTYQDLSNTDTLINNSNMTVNRNLSNGNVVSGSIALVNDGMITVGQNFSNKGYMEGDGSYCIQDVSTNMGTVNGNLSFCDQSGDDFDTNTGTVAGTVVFCTAGACIVGLDENQTIAVQNVYPNPVSHDLNLEMSQPGYYQVTVLSSTGALVTQLSFTGTRTSLDLATLNPGLYLYRISEPGNDQGFIHTGRLVKQ